jgi:hypothetical protein
VSRRVSWQQKDREFRRQVDQERARKAVLREWEEYGAFVMDADQYILALIEQFGATAVRGQRSENEAAYRKDVVRMQREHARSTLADALKAAQRHAGDASRFVLYSEERKPWNRRSMLGDPCMAGEYGVPFAARRKRALADLAKLGISPECVNPNACNESGNG